MSIYKAFVTDKEDKRRLTIEREYPTKQDFIDDLRRNGYAVNPAKVKIKKEFDRIVNTTNLNKWDWQPRKYNLSKNRKSKSSK